MDRKVKSPSYPSVSLSKSLEFARHIYDKANKGEIHPTVAVSLMGYKGLSGPSSSALSSLKKFGLLEGRGDSVKITELALKILEPLEPVEKSRAVAKSFMLPELYSLIIDEYEGIPDEEVIVAVLKRKYNFSSTGAETFIKAFRESVEFAKQYGEFQKILNPNKIDTVKVNDKSIRTSIEDLEPEQNQNKIIKEYEEERLRFKLSEDVFVDVVFEGDVSCEAIEKLAKLLELTKDSYPSYSKINEKS